GKLAETLGTGEMKAAQEERQRLATDQAANDAADAQIAQRRQQLYAQADAIGNARINPNAVFDNASTWQKIVGAIAIGLGGYAATQTRGQNVALGIIQSQIDNSIKAQMANLESQRAGFSAKNSLLAQDIAANRNAADARHQATIAAYDLAIK